MTDMANWRLPPFSEKGPVWVAGGIEIRCPGKFKKLFLVLLREHLPQEGMYMEIACSDCARMERAEGTKLSRVLHYYDTSGNCVDTKIV